MRIDDAYKVLFKSYRNSRSRYFVMKSASDVTFQPSIHKCKLRSNSMFHNKRKQQG